jgi:hypothetical protein
MKAIIVYCGGQMLLLEEAGLPGENHRQVIDIQKNMYSTYRSRSHRGRDRMAVGFTTICSISVYHH